MSNEAPVVTIKCALWYTQNMTTLNDMAGKFTVDLAQLSDAAITALEDMGLTIQNKGDHRGSYITCKSKMKFRAEDETRQPILLRGRTPVDEEDDPNEGVSIGYGTKATCVVGYYDCEYMKKSGRSPSCKKIIINELIPYEAEESVDLSAAV